jgi:hypothetical protein
LHEKGLTFHRKETKAIRDRGEYIRDRGELPGKEYSLHKKDLRNNPHRGDLSG